MDTLTRRLRTTLGATLLACLTILFAGCGPNLFERMRSPYWGVCGTLIIILDIIALIDLLGDEMRDFGNKVLWALLIIFFPIGGLILYYFFGRD